MGERELATRLEMRTKIARSSLEDQLRSYSEVLHGLRTNFMHKSDLSRQDFRLMYEALELEKRYPVIHGIGFSVSVAAASLSGFYAELQRDVSAASQRNLTQVDPAYFKHEDLHIVKYYEPAEKYALSIGTHHDAEPKRRHAIEQARDSGEMTVTGRVKLRSLPSVDEGEGIVFFLPVYEGEKIPRTQFERRKAFIGVLFLGIRIDKIPHGIFGPEVLKDIDVEIFDVRTDSSNSKSGVHNMVFDSGQYSGQTNLHIDHPDWLQRSEQMRVGATYWHLQVTALPNFSRISQQWLPMLASLSALLLSFLAFLFMRLLESRHNLAVERAAIAKQTLQTKEAQLTRICNSIHEILWSIAIPGNQTIFANAAADRIYGRPLQDFYQNPLLWQESIHPEDQLAVLTELEKAIQTGYGEIRHRIIRPDGEIRWIQVKGYFIPGDTPGTGILDGTSTDITALHHATETLLRKNQALEAIHACDVIIAQSRNEEDLLQGVCDMMVANGYRMAWAGVVSGSEYDVIIPKGIAGEHQNYLGSIQDALHLGPKDAGTLGESLRTFRPVVSNRFAEDVRLAPWREQALQRGYRAKIAMPLCDEGQALGILNVYAQKEDAFDDEEVGLLQGLANRIAAAVQSNRHRLARQNAEAGLRLRQRAIEASANPIAISRAEARDFPVEYVNPAFERITGYTAAEIAGKSLLLLFRDDLDQPGLAEIQRAVEQQREGHVVLREYHRNGTLFWMDVFISPVRDETGRVTHFISAMYDITANKQYQEELEYQANYDVLTGLANRKLLHQRLSQAITRAATDNQPVRVVFLNLNRFKFVNDSMGMAAGDILLKEVAVRLQSSLRPTDTAARITADEFVLLLTGPDGEETVTSIVHSALRALAMPIAVKGQRFFLTGSAGIATYPEDGANADTLLKHAGIAMHRAKERRGGNFQVYTESMNQSAMERLRLEGDLRHALQRNELMLHYQPQVDLRTGQIVGTEALLRWQHPQLGMVRPDQFIRLAEESGQIVEIGAWVMRSACLQNKAWQEAGFETLRISVNLSGIQFYQPDLVELVATVLSESRLAAHYLDIELTESLVMHDVGLAIETMSRLKALGITLSIDDFGTGYSSLSYLRRFPIDVLKIDRSFVNDISHNANDAAISRAIISLAHTLGIQVIAEGVETQAQCEFLSQNMCDEIQGYLFSKPLPASELEALLQENRQLPQHLLRLHKPLRTLLLVDDEPNILSALKRLLRRDSYRILTAASGKEGLELLAKNEIGVIVSDQRMPGMTGVDFLRTVKTLYPETVRIVLSGFTELQSVTDAVNEGAIYKFLTKPWDDNQLREHITHAFHHKEMVDENRRLTLEVRTANHDLATANRRLEEVLEQKQQQITRSKVSLDIVREALQHVPLPVFGLDDDEMVAFVNHAAEELYANTGPILGAEAAHLMPQLMHAIYSTTEGKECKVKLNGLTFHAVTRSMGNGTQSRGKLIILSPCDAA